MDILALVLACAPSVAPGTMSAIIDVESGGNPYAIGVVGGRLERQPSTLAEARATAAALEAGGHNYSVGIAQINRSNLVLYGVSVERAFDPCTSLELGARVLKKCFERASDAISGEQPALHAALSCYYSGNFRRGLRPDSPGSSSYVQRVITASGN